MTIRTIKYIIYYLRYSLVAFAPSVFILCLIEFLSLEVSQVTKMTILILIATAIPGYLILPGMIDSHYKPGRYSTGNVNFLDIPFYLAFTVVTMGIGPAVLYWVKWEPEIKKMFK